MSYKCFPEIIDKRLDLRDFTYNKYQINAVSIFMMVTRAPS